jgi:flagellar basal body-associated protein FliL
MTTEDSVPPRQDQQGRSRLLLIALIAAILAVGLAVAAWLMHASLNQPEVRPPLGAEAKAYLEQISVTNAKMSAADTPLGATLTYLDAEVVNQGTRTVTRLDLRLEFFDTLNQVVLRQTVYVITPDTAPLKAAGTRNIHLTFEHMPAEWNQAPPAITPVYVAF